LKSWPCFSPKTRQIQASDGKFGAGNYVTGGNTQS
jgi:hypothetical protein